MTRNVRLAGRWWPLFALLAILPAAAAVAQSAASPFTTGYRYDTERRVTGTIAPDPDGATGPLKFAAVRNTYNPSGQLIKVETGELAAWQSEAVAPGSWSGFIVFQAVDTIYDLMGRKLKETLSGRDPATGQMVIQTVTQTKYDNMGRPECTAVRMNPATFATPQSDACLQGTQGAFGPDRITRNSYDAAGRLIRVQAGYGTADRIDVALYTYTVNGKMASLTDANGNRAEMLYDGHDRQVRWILPSKTSTGSVDPADYEEYGYDPNGNRISLRKRDSKLITSIYDALNRITSKTVPVSSTGAPGYGVSYGYDLRGLQRSAFFTATGQGVGNAWDNAGRMTSTTTTMGGISRQLAFEYDRNSNRTKITHPDPVPNPVYFTYEYDGRDRLVMARENGGATIFVSFAYDAQGRRTGLGRGNGAATGYSYDLVSRLASLTQNIGQNPTDPAGDLTLELTYNPASQIVTHYASNNAYAWTNGVSVTRPYTVNGLNQYTVAGQGVDQVTFLHDGNGNLRSSSASGNTFTLTYDAENRLVTASGAKTATLIYDPLGRLYETSGGSPGVTRFLYDGDALVAEYGSTGNLIRRYFHGPGVDEPLLWYEVAGGVGWRYVHANYQGSVTAVSASNGALVAINSYDEYGIPAPTNLGRFAYTGQIKIYELDMYHYKARIYSPTLGRFLQTDPIGYDDQTNLYAYVGNDPVNGTDPSGMVTIGSCEGDGRGDVSAMCSGENAMGAAIEHARALATRGESSVVSYLAQPAPRRCPGWVGNMCGTDKYNANNDPVVIALYNDPRIRRAMKEAWAKAKASGHEYGFWISVDKKGRFTSHGVYGGWKDGMRALTMRPPGAQIFFHIHPNPNLSPRISSEDVDVTAANVKVIAYARGNNFYAYGDY